MMMSVKRDKSDLNAARRECKAGVVSNISRRCARTQSEEPGANDIPSDLLSFLCPSLQITIWEEQWWCEGGLVHLAESHVDSIHDRTLWRRISTEITGEMPQHGARTHLHPGTTQLIAMSYASCVNTASREYTLLIWINWSLVAFIITFILGVLTISHVRERCYVF
jgi:hypothetical protein